MNHISSPTLTTVWDSLSAKPDALRKKYPKLTDLDILTKMELPQMVVDADVLSLFHSQVANGGFEQWHYNGYGDCTMLVARALSRIKPCDVINKMRDIIINVRGCLRDLDDENVLSSYKRERLSKLDDQYYEIMDEFCVLVEAHFNSLKGKS